jgi:hypothetical protein
MMMSNGKIHAKVKPKDRIFRVKVKSDGEKQRIIKHDDEQRKSPCESQVKG